MSRRLRSLITQRASLVLLAMETNLTKKRMPALIRRHPLADCVGGLGLVRPDVQPPAQPRVADPAIFVRDQR